MYDEITKKGIFAPDYYKDFKCIADRCRHSCCTDWEICIDGAAYAKYMKTEDILSTVKDYGDGPCFELCEDGRCPHLNGDGLCNIIIKYGEDYLSEICRNHPRFYNFINDSRIEAGLGIVCEEACRLVLESEAPFLFSEIESNVLGNRANSEADFNALPQRDRIFSVIKGEGEFDDKLSLLKKEFGLPELYNPNGWLERFLSLEILDAEWERDLVALKGKKLCANKELTAEYGKYYERLLAYFVYRHVSVAEDEVSLRARLAFCILSAELIRLLFEGASDKPSPFKEGEIPDALINWARRYSAEIEYSEDNTDELIFLFESRISA